MQSNTELLEEIYDEMVRTHSRIGVQRRQDVKNMTINRAYNIQADKYTRQSLINVLWGIAQKAAEFIDSNDTNSRIFNRVYNGMGNKVENDTVNGVELRMAVAMAHQYLIEK